MCYGGKAVEDFSIVMGGVGIVMGGVGYRCPKLGLGQYQIERGLKRFRAESQLKFLASCQ